MKIIIVGGGKLGSALAMQLSKEAHDVVIIDVKSDVLQSVSNIMDVSCVSGNAVDKDVLESAGAHSADLLIAVTSGDELNIISCLIAKKLGTRHTIARVRDPNYSKSVFLIREELGLTMSINPEFEAAFDISRTLRFPSAIKVDFFAKGKLELAEFRISPTSPLASVPLSQLQSKFHARVIVCAVERGEDVLIPDGSFVLQPGDRISFTAAPRDTAIFLRSIGLNDHRVRSVMIVGGSKTAYYLAKMLEDSGIQVKIIEESVKRCKQLSDNLDKAMVILGNGADQETLLEEGITEVDALVALTGMDEVNIVISMYAQMNDVFKVVTKINHIHIDKLIDRAGIESIITPHLISTNQIVRYVRAMQNSLGSNVEALTRIVDGRVEALEFHVRDSFSALNIPLKDLQLKKGLLIACIFRNGRLIFPTGGDCIYKRDNVIVVTTISGFEELNDILA